MSFKALVASILIALSLLTALHLSLRSGSDSEYLQYQLWKQRYQLNIPPLQDNYRRLLYFANKRQIELFNRQTNHTYRQGINQFTALTQAEFQLIYLKPSASAQILQDQVPMISFTVNWLAKGIVSPVKDQGTCASCWAFSAVAILESHALSNHQSLLFSEQLVDCSEDYGNSGCYGGFNFNALHYIKDHGITQDSQYPYKAMSGDCQFQGGSYRIRSVKSVKGCTELYSAIALRPLAVTVDAVRWRAYSSGIFNDCDKAVNHDVFLVGLSPTFYLIKNSWGSSWGEQGYIRLTLGNTCGICSERAYYVSTE